MPLNKLKALYILLSGMLITGIVSYLPVPTYISALPGILFSLIIPGFVILLNIEEHLDINWSTILKSVGLGTLNIYLLMLLLNGLLPSLGVDRPLQKKFIFLTLLIGIILQLIIGYKLRWRIVCINLTASRQTRFDFLNYSATPIVLALSIFGAIRLNNGSSGSVAIIGAIAGISYLVFIYINSPRMTQASQIFAVWLIALSAILAGWLRFRYVAGPDVDKEFQIFRLIKQTELWNISLYRNAYNACLSVNLLPVALSYVTKIPDLLIFKFLLPTLYSLIIPIIYIISTQLSGKKFAVLPILFFCAQPPFNVWWWIPIRQQVAFLFFGLFTLVFLQDNKSPNIKKILLFLFSIGVILSHYSTSYTLIIILTLYIILRYLLTKKTRRANIALHYIRPTTLLVLVLATFFWYSQVTYGFSGVTSFLSKSITNVGSSFATDSQQNGQGLFDHLNIFSTAGIPRMTTLEYIEQKINTTENDRNRNLTYTGNEPNSSITYQKVAALNTNSPFSLRLDRLRSMAKVLSNVLIVATVLYSFVKLWRQRTLSDYAILSLSALVALVIVMMLPFFSINYGPDRFYLQVLIVCAPTIAVYANSLHKKGKGIFSAFFISLLIINYTLLSQIVFCLTESNKKSINFSNDGSQYLTYSIKQSDALSASWIQKIRTSSPLYGDGYAEYRIVSTTSLEGMKNLRTGLIPAAILKSSYIYSSSANQATGVVFDRSSGNLLYDFPADFLNDNKSVIYTNNSSSIYR